MLKLDQYQDRYECVRISRDDGVIEVALHADGGPARWSDTLHRELADVFHNVGSDPENRVMILTGTGDAWATEVDGSSFDRTFDGLDRTYREGKQTIRTLLDIEIPVIGVVNGPALIHAELPLLSDVVIASDTAVFKDAGHFPTGTVPGDGVNILWPMWLGLNRGRHFLLMGQQLDAKQAFDLGLVAEVMAPELLHDRARQIATELLRQPRLTLRYTRLALTLGVRRAIEADFSEGIAVEFLAKFAHQGVSSRP